MVLLGNLARSMTQLANKHQGPSGAPDFTGIEVENLTVDFSAARSAVRGVSFSVRSGETLAIVGESGSGKSVTSMAMMRLLPPQAKVTGSIRLKSPQADQDILALSERQMRILRGAKMGMIFQEPMTSLNPLQRVETQIIEAIRLHQSVSAQVAREMALNALVEVGMPDPATRLKAFPFELSGGMRQRVMIAMALACRPDFLVADEPTTALDVTVQAQIVELLARLQRERGMAMLFITHDLALVSNFADRIMVMYAGTIVESAPAAQLFEQPRHPYTIGLLQSIPSPGQTRQKKRLVPIRAAELGDAAPITGCAFAPRCRHARAGVCDAVEPKATQAGPDHMVRCVRWSEIASENATA